MSDLWQDVTDNVVTVTAIAGIAFLGYHGITDLATVGAIAGLGGYNLMKHKNA